MREVACSKGIQFSGLGVDYDGLGIIKPHTPELIRFTYLVIALFFPTLSQTLTFKHFNSIMASAQQKLEYYVSQIDKEVSLILPN